MEFRVFIDAVFMAVENRRYRNRVEFRVIRNFLMFGRAIVDIGTEWNLELFSVSVYELAVSVDIGTEWNLENGMATVCTDRKCGRYRNRVEFRDVLVKE